VVREDDGPDVVGVGEDATPLLGVGVGKAGLLALGKFAVSMPLVVEPHTYRRLRALIVCERARRYVRPESLRDPSA
jgi:hypothetical protein